MSFIDEMGAYCFHADSLVVEQGAFCTECDIHGAISDVACVGASFDVSSRGQA
jgi:hypothetical protein